MRLICMLFCLITYPLLASMESHYRKANDKDLVEPHQMRNIDFIYMINLDQRPEKFAQSLNELAPYDIVPYRFSAVNGWELSLEELNAAGIQYQPWMRQDLMGTCYLPEDGGEPRHEVMQQVGRNYYCHCMSRGAIGISLSHLSIIKDAYDSGYETIWVMEDDIEVIKDPHLISEMIARLDKLVGKQGWDFLFTDFDTKNKKGEYVPCTGYAFRPDFTPHNTYKFMNREDVSQDFRKVGARYGAYSVIVRRSGMKKMLDHHRDGIFLPYDMEYTLPNDINMFTVRDDIVSTQPDALSDNGAPNYKLNLIQHDKE